MQVEGLKSNFLRDCPVKPQGNSSAQSKWQRISLAKCLPISLLSYPLSWLVLGLTLQFKPSLILGLLVISYIRPWSPSTRFQLLS